MGWEAGSVKGGWLTAFNVIVLLVFVWHAASASADDVVSRRKIAANGQTPSAAAQSTAAWVVSSGDHQNHSFVIVDKIAAKLYVHQANGTLLASTSILLGLAPGDHSVPGIGERRIADIRPAERTTPAGRFLGEAGKNLDGEHIIWIDYDAALAIHRLRAGPAYQQHLKRMASTSTADKRLSYGCVVVPVHFYEQVIAPTFARKAMIYVLPETNAAASLFISGQY